MTRIQTLASRPKRTLGALAVVLAAVGITVGSGANFSASQANAGNVFATGDLTIGRDVNSAILSLNNMKPGDAQSGQITVQNTGSLKGDFFLAQSFAGTPDAGLESALNLTIVHCDSVVATDPCNPLTTDGVLGIVYNGSMAGYPTSSSSLPDMASGSRWAGGAQNRYEFTVTLPGTVTDNALQGKSVDATYTWSATS